MYVIASNENGEINNMRKVNVPRNGPDAKKQLMEKTANVCKRRESGMDSGANSIPSTIIDFHKNNSFCLRKFMKTVSMYLVSKREIGKMFQI